VFAFGARWLRTSIRRLRGGSVGLDWNGQVQLLLGGILLALGLGFLATVLVGMVAVPAAELHDVYALYPFTEASTTPSDETVDVLIMGIYGPGVLSFMVLLLGFAGRKIQSVRDE